VPDTDRRVWGRFPADLEVSFHPAGVVGEAPMSAKVKDISKGGINLLVKRKFDTGDLLSIELPKSGDPAMHSVLGCIVRVLPEGDDAWAVGCVFSRELSEEDLQGFGAQRVRHPPSDQRIWMRFPVKVKAAFQRVSTPYAEFTPTQVINISASGVGLIVSDPIEAGTLLNVELESPSGKFARTMLVCVVHVSGQASGDFALGCNFIHELSEEDLQALL